MLYYSYDGAMYEVASQLKLTIHMYNANYIDKFITSYAIYNCRMMEPNVEPVEEANPAN